MTEHRGVLQQRPLRGGQPVEPGCDKRVEGFRNLEVREIPGNVVAGALLNEHAAILEHADGLDGVQRDPFRALDDLTHHVIRKSRREPVEQPRYLPRLQWSEREWFPSRPAF